MRSPIFAMSFHPSSLAFIDQLYATACVSSWVLVGLILQNAEGSFVRLHCEFRAAFPPLLPPYVCDESSILYAFPNAFSRPISMPLCFLVRSPMRFPRIQFSGVPFPCVCRTFHYFLRSVYFLGCYSMRSPLIPPTFPWACRAFRHAFRRPFRYTQARVFPHGFPVSSFLRSTGFRCDFPSGLLAVPYAFPFAFPHALPHPFVLRFMCVFSSACCVLKGSVIRWLFKL